MRQDRSGWLRDTTFVVGGGLVIGLGIAFGLGLWWAGAGWEFVTAWVGVGLTVGFGVFFVYVGVAERRDRRGFLERYDPDRPPRPPDRS